MADSKLAQNAQAVADAGAKPHVAAADGEPGPDATSSDYDAMKPLWDKVAAFAGGEEGMRRQAETYLPRYEAETDADWKLRKKETPFTNVYEDVSRNLSEKPFSRQLAYADPDEVGEGWLEFYDDVDGRGNNMHVFASESFGDGIDHGIEWILVDHTKLPPLSPGKSARTLDEEKALGARVYWVKVPATSVLAAYSDMADGREVWTHVRLRENVTIREKYKEVVKERVRVFNRERVEATAERAAYYMPATWELLEKRKRPNSDKWDWVRIESGDVQIGVIPAVPVRTGKRRGNGCAVEAPLAGVADMQVAAYRLESKLANLESLTGFPMLTGNGVKPPAPVAQPGGPPASPRLKVGPRTVLFAPPPPGGGNPGSWSYLEPSHTSHDVLQKKLENTWANMREIGMQPLAEANITVVTSANVSVKAKCALQAWVLRLEDALEQALVVTALWRGLPAEDAPGVDVYKDFGVDTQSGKDMETLSTMAADGELSGETLRAEAKRRGVLSDNFDEDEEKVRLAAEQGLEGEEDIDPVTGLPINDNFDEGDPEDEEGLEPVDGSVFANADQIDNAALEALFGADLVAQAG